MKRKVRDPARMIESDDTEIRVTSDQSIARREQIRKLLKRCPQRGAFLIDGNVEERPEKFELSDDSLFPELVKYPA